MSAELVARWAADAFSRYDKESVDRIVRAAAEAGAAYAARYAAQAVQETGVGVVADQEAANLAATAIPGGDFVTPHRDRTAIRLPRPVGVVLARIAPVLPVAGLYRTVLACLSTRNALLLSPDPACRDVCTQAAAILAETVRAAGAPEGVIQIGECDDADLVLEPPARPDCVPVLVDGTADLPQAADAIRRARAFNNSTVDTSPAVLIVVEAVASELIGLLEHGDTPVHLAPLDLVEPPAQPGPALAVVRVGAVRQGIQAARAAVRLGAGRRASVHSTDPETLRACLAALPVARLDVNGAGDTVAGWAGTDPAPERLVRWTTMVAPAGTEVTPATPVAPAGPVPAYPRASNGA